MQPRIEYPISQSAPIVKSGCVGAWFFRGTNGAEDISGYGASSALNGNVIKNGSDGGYDFGGTPQRIILGTDWSVIFRSNFSISLWFRPLDGQPAANQCVFGQDDNVPANSGRVSFILQTTGLLNGYYKEAGGNINIDTAVLMVNGQEGWHYANYVFDATTKTLFLYVDGVLKISGTNAGITPANYDCDYGLGVGCYWSDGAGYNYYTGKIREMIIHNRILTASEIKYNYIRGVPQ